MLAQRDPLLQSRLRCEYFENLSRDSPLFHSDPPLPFDGCCIDGYKYHGQSCYNDTDAGASNRELRIL